MSLPVCGTLQLDATEPHVLVVTLDRPDALNALNTRMAQELLALWNRLTEDPGQTRCVVLTGRGERAFCAGGDLKERDGMTVDAWRHQHELFERMYRALGDLPLPVVAAVNGHAFGGGLEMALACDFIYAVRAARFALPEVKLGIMPGGGGTQLLPRAIGERRAKELLLSGRAFDAGQGERWGLVSEIADDVAGLRVLALDTARTIAANAPLSVRQAKKAVRYGMQMELSTALRFEVEAYNHLVDTEDRHEGVRAFVERRAPRFVGR